MDRSPEVHAIDKGGVTHTVCGLRWDVRAGLLRVGYPEREHITCMQCRERLGLD